MIVYERFWPGLSSLRLQVTVRPSTVHGTLVFGSVTSAGRVVTTSVEVDELGPLLATLIVQVSASPTVTGSGESVIPIARSVVLLTASIRAASCSSGNVPGSTSAGASPGCGNRVGRYSRTV